MIANKFVPHAQFHPNGPRTTLEDSDGIIGWRENQILFTFYEDKILGQHIKILDDVDTIAYEFVCKATESMKLDALLTGIQKLELAVVVNRATLCKVVLDVPSVTARWKDEDGDFWVQFRSTLPLDRRGVIYQYERLYEAEASEFGQKPMSLPIGPGILKGPHEAQKGHQTMAKPRAGLAATDTMR